MFSINPIQINLRHSSSKVLFAALVVACNLDVASAAVPMDNSHGVTHNFNQGKIKIKGKVVDSKTQEPLASVSILSEGIAKATTDRNGNFEVDVEVGGKIRFQLIGYEAQTKIFEATQSNLQIALNPTSAALEEVVVTALGIKRQERELGYSATVVKGEQLTDALSNNWSDALSGKVAGLNLMRSNAGPTGSTKIILRGEASLSGDKGALIVIDGVVVNDGSGRRTANQGENTYGTGSDNMPADYGSGIDDINPEDIENITVLKGAGAAALYGQRGANGAIMITTKSGSKGKKGIGVTVNSNTSLEAINRMPDLQYEYGQGLAGSNYYSYGTTEDGASTSGTSSAYGPKFDGQYFYQYDPVTQKVGTERTLWRPYDNLKTFFDVGKTFTNSVSIDGGTEKTSARFSATNVNNTWIVPNTGYKRNTVALSVNSKVSDKLQINAKVNYTNKWSDNLPGAGYGNQSLMYWFIFWQPNADMNWLKDYWVQGSEGQKIKYPFSSYPENPFAISREFINGMNRNGITGNVQASYQFNKNWNLMLRSSMDMAYENREQKRPYDAGAKMPFGSYRTQSIFSHETTLDFLLKYDKEVNKDWKVSATVGGSTNDNRYNKDEMRADSLTYPGVYTMANAKGQILSLPYKSRMQSNSLYGFVTAAYKNFLFVDGTYRADWASTLASALAPDKRTYFTYPSLNASFIASEVWKLPKAINYAKLRGSVAGVGNGGGLPYIIDFSYESAGPQYPGGIQIPSTMVNPFLEPLRTLSFEFGTEVRMFRDRFGFDVAVYQGATRNQQLRRVVDASTGARYKMVNAGEVRNKGIEVAMDGMPIKIKDGFSWKVFATFSMNQNKITELGDSTMILQTGPVAGGQLVAKVGGSMGDLYGIGYQRSPDGQIIYDGKTGVALLTDEVVYLGNTIPKGKVSLGHEFKYKGFRLNLLFDAQFGGVSHSLTHYKLAEQGKTKNTLPGRYSGIIGNGVVQNADGTYRKNDVIATDIDEYYRSHYGQDNAEGSTFSTNFIKFREARFDYSFSKAFVNRLKLQKASVGVYGRNLVIWSNWPNFDPEFGTLSGSDIVKGFEIAQFPSTRTYGVNLIVGF
ncbi:SusC/RagA family TonB-linked outer membrane protein [Sphingobacterium detergens]|uniref:TonB-linked SusC/RagA family outer membrane protein n=1 Tax=Sphingobacterium detergens TaxID=1145106 RepID=A0A420AYF8_SPHD1|nr:SusC/RagA family TonB-linked outer membrane protein [Sphingobacterium detergens]RKE49589.1 TonB-linked SusC/RagA family outer membrane protein [Sphingobacterium detergens]